MARMKFLCDAERCIECNGCVTACKNENEVPWGVNRRRVVTLNDGVPGEQLDLGRLHALLRRAVHGGVPGRLLLPHRRRRGAARQGPLHRLRLLLLRLPVRRAAVPARRRLRRARQDGQVHVLRRRPGGQRLARPSSRSTAATAWPKASCRPAPRCARPRRCSAATATWSPTSSATACSRAARAPRSGAGARPTASRRRRGRHQPAEQVMRRLAHVAPRWRWPLALGRLQREAADRRSAASQAPTAPALQGTGTASRRRAGRPGDKASWEQQLQDARPERRTNTRRSTEPRSPCRRMRAEPWRLARRSRVPPSPHAQRRRDRRAAPRGTSRRMRRRAAPQAASAARTSSTSSPRRADAADPNYLKQTQRRSAAKVQPGNNAPMWRGCAAGSDRLHQPARSEAPEAGVLIQPLRAVPRLALHQRRRSLAAGAQQLDHSLRRLRCC